MSLTVIFSFFSGELQFFFGVLFSSNIFDVQGGPEFQVMFLYCEDYCVRSSHLMFEQSSTLDATSSNT